MFFEPSFVIVPTRRAGGRPCERPQLFSSCLRPSAFHFRYLTSADPFGLLLTGRAFYIPNISFFRLNFSPDQTTFPLVYVCPRFFLLLD